VKKSASGAAAKDRAAGVSLLLLALVLLLSLLSYSSRQQANWLGVLGHVIGWILLYCFGLGGYLVIAGCCWCGFLKLKGRPLRPEWAFSWLGLVVSVCLILTVMAGAFPQLGLRLHRWVYTDIITHVAPLAYREIRFHLGGVLFTELYDGLPLVNLRELLSPIGTSLVAVGLASVCLILLADIRPLTWLQELLSWVRRPEKKAQEMVLEPPSRAVADLPEPFEEIEESPAPDTPKVRSRPAALPKASRAYKGYQLPPLSLLTSATKSDQTALRKGLRQQADILEETLASFGITAKVGDIHCGPTITSFEVHPPVGVKVQKIQALEKDLALNLRANAIRLIAPIPGKAAVGVEIPNPRAQEVGLKEMLETYQSQNANCRIPFLIGKTVNGEDLFADLVQMPHLLIAGATGSGKSVCLNTLIVSILMTARPDQVKLLMVDPKRVELTSYSQLPHMVAPVITEPKEACIALHWLVKEMERRYELLRQLGLRNIEAFNMRTVDPDAETELDIEVPEQMSYIVAIIDELADLMMVSSSDIETPITRIAQMARAVGIHLVLATQRPSREVLTGLIKANFPARLAFKVSSRVNSQIILDEPGAEALLGNGDLLFRPPGTHHLTRAQAPYVRDEDINAIRGFICQQGAPNYLIPSFREREDLLLPSEQETNVERDELYERAHELVLTTGVASTTFLQRKLKIGYARAASIMDQLEARGIVGPADGSKARELLARLPR
jgi:DNA segregation ATPase FtsK/SpoIIIE, S-DNA-T family